MSWNPDDWLNIPQELQARPQWMVCKEDKAPLTLSGYNGDPTDKTNWSSFADAYVRAIELHGYIGFCLSDDDPYTIIDMDNKEQRQEYVDVIQGTCDYFDTYIERSMSGRGYHAILLGDIGPGRRQAPFEIYSRERFMIMTGDVIKPAPISAAYQNALLGLAEFCGEAIEHDKTVIDWTSPPSEEELYYDNCCLQWFGQFSNVGKIEYAFEGRDFSDPSADNSKFDAFLMQLYYKFNAWRPEQRERATIRMFLRSPRAQALRRKPDWQQYIARTLGFVRKVVDTEELQAVGLQSAVNKMGMGLNGHMEQRAEIGGQWMPPAQAQINPFRFFNASELKTRPDIPWAVHNLLPVGGLAAIYGESGAGKSFIALDMIGAIARGVKWFRRQVMQLPVCCLALEGSGGLKKRVLAWESAHHMNFPDEVKFYDGAFNLRADKGAFNNPGNVAMIHQFCAALNGGGKFGGVVFVDTLNQASEGADENSSRDMNQLIQGAKLIQQLTNSLVVLIHHATKNRENQSMRGHGSFKAACDAVIEVYEERDAEGKPTGNRGWIAEKVKDSESGDTGAFKLVGQFGTNSVCIQEMWEPVQVHDDATGDDHFEERPVSVKKRNGREKAPENGNSGGKPWDNGNAPMGGAKSEQAFRTSVNERKLRDGWKGLKAQWGEWVPMEAVQDYMLHIIMGTTKSNKMTTLNRVLTKLEGLGQLKMKVDDKGGQWVMLH